MKCPHCQKEVQLFLMPTGPSMKEPRQQPKPPQPTIANVDASGVKSLLAKIHADDLDAYPREFIENTKARMEKYGYRFTMTEPQMNYLRKIADGGGRKDDWE